MKFVLNTLISALIIATVAEVAKRSTFVATMLKTGLNFWVSLAVSAAGMFLVFYAYAWTLKKFGIDI